MSERGRQEGGGKGNASQQTHSGLAEVCVCVREREREREREEDEFIVRVCTVRYSSGGWMLIRRHACLSWWWWWWCPCMHVCVCVCV